MRLTIKFEARVTEVSGSRSITEVKHIALTDTYADTTGIGEVIATATKAVEAMVTNTSDNTKAIDVVLVSIVPAEEVVVNKTAPTIEEPADVATDVVDDFAANMNAPVNVVEEIPEGMVRSDEIEESPFTNTYYDETGVADKVAEIEEPKEPESQYDYDDMFNKFLSLNYLTRQNLLIRNETWGPLLPENHRGDRHKVAFPIAVDEATKKGVLNDFYAKIDEAVAKK